MLNYSIARLSALTGISTRRVQTWTELGLLSRDLDVERLHHWLIASDLRQRGLPLALIAKAIQTWRKTGAPFLVVDRDHGKVLALHDAEQVLQRFAESATELMLVDLR